MSPSSALKCIKAFELSPPFTCNSVAPDVFSTVRLPAIFELPFISAPVAVTTPTTLIPPARTLTPVLAVINPT